MKREYKIKATMMPDGEVNEYSQFVITDNGKDIDLWEDPFGEVEDIGDAMWSELNPSTKKNRFKSIEDVKSLLVNKGLVNINEQIVEI